MSETGRPKPPYIRTQRCFVLKEDIEDPFRYLTPQDFRAGRLGEDGRPQEAPPSNIWEPVTREQLFFNAEHRLTCLTSDAGMGKSEALYWAQAKCPEVLHDVLAVYVRLRDLPATAAEYPAVLAGILRTAPAKKPFTNEQVEEVVERLIRNGRLLLLVDGLDEIRSPDQAQAQENPLAQSETELAPTAIQKVEALGQFLNDDGRDCRAVVAGRPYAVQRFRKELFQGSRWRFSQV